jgi:hypothetical protein
LRADENAASPASGHGRAGRASAIASVVRLPLVVLAA